MNTTTEVNFNDIVCQMFVKKIDDKGDTTNVKHFASITQNINRPVIEIEDNKVIHCRNEFILYSNSNKYIDFCNSLTYRQLSSNNPAVAFTLDIILKNFNCIFINKVTLSGFLTEVLFTGFDKFYNIDSKLKQHCLRCVPIISINIYKQHLSYDALVQNNEKYTQMLQQAIFVTAVFCGLKIAKNKGFKFKENSAFLTKVINKYHNNQIYEFNIGEFYSFIVSKLESTITNIILSNIGDFASVYNLLLNYYNQTVGKNGEREYGDNTIYKPINDTIILLQNLVANYIIDYL
jgi:hypothetical protein